jgi:hypothetical protein
VKKLMVVTGLITIHSTTLAVMGLVPLTKNVVPLVLRYKGKTRGKQVVRRSELCASFSISYQRKLR